MSGPPKTPTHLRLVRGNPSKRAINKNEPKPPSGVPPTPKHFDKQGKYWFKRMAEELDALGVMSQLDARALELLVEAYTEYRHHCEVLDQEGYSYKTDEGLVKPHPQAAMKADVWKRMRGMLGEFGMTPSSRSKVNTTGPDQVDPMAEFMKARD
ncbi:MULTISPECIES: phage terminase small subunit P27 family [Serratia]|uniref:phage terminase small subunit P27 family n=1 Tax=Serratia TaxID=613 RepID=UPI000BA20614|nr:MULTISPECIES: phage terminase small subunit P27 family [Serratia]MBL5904441.1 phage terminase small subunit P27 family [Serratia fonticola]PAA97731.1 terminase [Serratia fonticola]UAN59898.1 phage terminase small subunit P27 family [Serratia sp. JSRIV004]